MAAAFKERLAGALARMQWGRGLRAGAVVVSIAVVCGALHLPLGWACVGGFLSVIVDTGGPYRSRLATVATFLAGGAVAAVVGWLASSSLVASIALTGLFCFAATFARVLSPAMASASVSILVCYFVAFGSGFVSAQEMVTSVGLFLSGGVWAGTLILFLWPVDPFRPARQAVAECFRVLAQLAEQLREPSSPESQAHAHAFHAQLRIAIESAHEALAATPARVASRTLRARNLAVLLEAADLLFARILRIAELTDGLGGAWRQEFGAWLYASTEPIAAALRKKPLNHGVAFAAEGSLTLDLRRRGRRLEELISESTERDENFAIAIERDCLLSLEVAYEAVRAIWSGAEPRTTRAAVLRSSLAQGAMHGGGPWNDALRANWTMRSVMMRHALRLAVVAVADVLLMRRIHVTHGFWLAMTSIIVLQPYAGHTLRRFAERVGGTVAGGILAAVLASALPNEPTLMAVVVLFAVISGAVYAVDYGWYCFFLTPTFVLLAMPHLKDWHFALIRMGTTVVGAATAVLAMLLLGRQRESVQLPGLLARGAAAEAAYLRATVTFWEVTAGQGAVARTNAERELLAPARRACGMIATEAEESLDRALLEPEAPFRARHHASEALQQKALTFAAYLRRLTQSITALAAIGAGEQRRAVEVLAERMDGVSQALAGGEFALPSRVQSPGDETLAAQQWRRLDRQVSILERTAWAICGGGPAEGASAVPWEL